MSRDHHGGVRSPKRRRLSPIANSELEVDFAGSDTRDGLGYPNDHGAESSPSDDQDEDILEDLETTGDSGEDLDGSTIEHGKGERLRRREPSAERNGGRADTQIPKNVSRSGSRQAAMIGTSLGSSNIFQLQVEELLQQAQPSYTHSHDAIGDMLLKLKRAIESIPSQDPKPLKEAEKRLLKSHKIPIPFPHPRPTNSAMYKFAYSKPTSINVIGSYALKTATTLAGNLVVDMVVHMPTELFEAKDYLNYRYAHKRAYYIACIAAGLQSSLSKDAELEFDLHNGNRLLPVLSVRPLSTNSNAALVSSSFTIKILPAFHDGFFPAEKTVPGCICIRKLPNGQDAGSIPQSELLFYNASVRSDSCVNSYLKLQHNAASRCAGYQAACILGSIWLRQRGFGASVAHGGFGRFELATTMALLMEAGGPKGRPVLSKAYNSTQLFGATLHFLAYMDLEKQPLIIGALRDLPRGYPTLFDGDRGINLLYKMSSSSYRLLRTEAQNSTKLFGSSLTSRFDSLFILKLGEPLLRFDLVFVLPQLQEKVEYQHSAAERIHEVLQRGLGDRVKLLSVRRPQIETWSVNMSRPSQDDTFMIGIVLDSVHASRTVDRGPPAENETETASFRHFWGEKAELRRFKDGEIRESLVWNSTESTEITKEIVLFLIGQHLGSVVGEGCKVLGNDFGAVADSSQAAKHQSAYSNALGIYRKLESAIRNMDGLPLRVRQMQATGIKLRNSETTTTGSGNKQSPPVDAVVQFEGSSRWPDDLVAVQMTKIAFLLKMEELLAVITGVESSRLGLENENNDVLNRAFLDVCHSGEWFRIRIHHEREQSLIERRLADITISPREREDAAVALAEYKRVFIRAPLHTQMIQRLGTDSPSFPQTLRLVKLWMSAQLLGNHFREELLEMITAKVFVEPKPWSVPSSPMTGFLRTISFLAQWDWQQDPLILDTSASMKSVETASIRTKFQAWRQIDPLMNRVSLFVATNYDPDGVSWSEYSPSKVVAARMTGLARAAMKLVKDKGLGLSLASLFKPSLKEYDFFLKLKQKSTSSKDGQSRFKNLRHGQVECSSDAGFDPVRHFLHELERIHGDAALFFADTTNNNIIAGLWNPNARRRRWKINLGWSTTPLSTQEDGEYDSIANTNAMLAEMAALGGDLIDSIIVT